MKLRKLKKNSVRNTDNTWQFKTEQVYPTSMGVHAGTQRPAREQKSFMETKTVPVVKHVEIWQFFFAKFSVGKHVRRGGQYMRQIVGNLFRCYGAKNYRNWLTFD